MRRGIIRFPDFAHWDMRPHMPLRGPLPSLKAALAVFLVERRN